MATTTNTTGGNRPASSPLTGERWTTAVAAVVLPGLALIVVSADGGPPNTGMADPIALVSAFDRAAAGGADDVLVLSLSNLRGVSSEDVNAGGTVSVDLTAGTVTSAVRLLPADQTFDLWLIDNRPAQGHTALAEPSDVLLRVGPVRCLVRGAHALGHPGARGLHRLLPGSRVCRATGAESG